MRKLRLDCYNYRVKSFDREYEKLNPSQQEAVDQIEGPVMVVAGPGTGKTQLLSMRVANILKMTDSLPSNILCLTFTESAAEAMRERLVGLIGQEAYQVAIHTFHSFGVEVINQHPEYFFQGAEFRPSDDLTSYQLLESLFSNLSHSNPLSTQVNGRFTMLGSTQSAISDLKKAGLTGEDLRSIVKHNEKFVKNAEPIVQKAFDVPRLTKTQLPIIEASLDEIKQIKQDEFPLPYLRPLKDVLVESLEAALEPGETKPITKWKATWLKKDSHNQYVFKDSLGNKKMMALATLYDDYQDQLSKQSLFDFDDMVLSVEKAISSHEDLKFDLQEKYLYVMVDEFQDTNNAQLQLLEQLINSPLNEGMPNVMAVGDDDQAIYRFQGAEVSNIREFRDLHKDASVVVLTENYRSSQEILDSARFVIQQGANRLENTYREINKELKANHTLKTNTERLAFREQTSELSWVAKQIHKLINAGHDPNEIAVIGRRHSSLEALMPHFAAIGVPVTYERRENVLEQPHIRELIQLSRAVEHLAKDELKPVDQLMPEIVSYDFWRIPTKDIWKLSKKAYDDRNHWLDVMLDCKNDQLKFVASFMIELARVAKVQPLEHMLDLLIGNESLKVDDDEFVSPYKSYYFSEGNFETARSQYLQLLVGVRAIRDNLKNFRPDQQLFLGDLIEFAELHRTSNTPIITKAEYTQASDTVHAMTAHKAKGLEFKTVFIINCQDTVWGDKAHKRSSQVKFPHNLPITPAGDDQDDRLRLFYVALTRAKQNLILTSNDELVGRNSAALPLRYLEPSAEGEQPANFVAEQQQLSLDVLASHLEVDWSNKHIEVTNEDNNALLQPFLDNYKLSVTHLTNFLDVTKGGPQYWLTTNFLRFPQSLPPAAAYGSAVHDALNYGHTYANKNNKAPTEKELVTRFKSTLSKMRLLERDYNTYAERGESALPLFLKHYYNVYSLDVAPEFDFSRQGIVVNDAPLTGKIDRIDIVKQPSKGNRGTIEVVDYKTGLPSANWVGTTDYNKQKLHRYKQQLIFYKLLIDNSREFKDKFDITTGSVVFVEPDKEGKVLDPLALAITDNDIKRMSSLIAAVWQAISNSNLPDVSKYQQNYKGILEFEEDLLAG